MNKVGKVILIVCGLALVSKACTKEDGRTSDPNSEKKLIGVTTVAHTEQAETYYGLPSWDWTYAEISSYDNGWNNVRFYVSGREDPVESNWYPQKK